ncbi:DoxX family membrane protein [Puniceicoccaceae bacterium K14]|nr:DoxX family membrane protein [Puniceicoccaceae bacterium K14]
MQKILNKIETHFFKNEYSFASNILRWSFGIYFLLVGVKKLRVDGELNPIEGILGFASSVTQGAMNTEIVAREIPSFLLYPYGLSLPFVELTAGVLLLIGWKIKFGYLLIGFTYISLIFGQMYSGNTGKIGTDYLPSLVALCIAVFAYIRNEKLNTSHQPDTQ